MKRGSIFIVSLLMLVGVIVLLLLIGKLGINGYSVYEGSVDSLAMQRGVTGNSVLGDLWNKFFGKDVQALSSPETCTNGIQDLDEQGVDCGGLCDYECPLSHIIGIDVEINGTPGVDYATEWSYHDKRVDDAKIIYIKDTVKIGLIANSHNRDGSPSIRYKIDRDEQGFGNYYIDNDLGLGPLTPIYQNQFSLSEKTYLETGQSVVGTIGSNGSYFQTCRGMDNDRQKYNCVYYPLGNRTNYGINDNFGDEWHTLTYWDNQGNVYDQRGDFDAGLVQFVVNPKTPLISFKNLTTTSQYYTTPAKTYFIPYIFNKTTYVTDNISISLVNIINSNAIFYKINGGTVQTYSAPINSNILNNGENTIEYWYDDAYHKKRTIIKNPDYPSKQEQHPHNFLWDSPEVENIIRDRITRDYYYEVFNSLYLGTENSIFNGFRFSEGQGSAALNNAFVAYFKGMNYNNGDYARRAKKMLTDSILMSDLIGQENGGNNAPAPFMHYYQSIGSMREAVFSVIAYDLLIGNYTTEKGYVDGFTPIEDIRVRDSLAYYAKTSLQFIQDVSMQNQNGMPPDLSDCRPGNLHFRADDNIGASIIALTIPKYDMKYYGTSGAPPDNLQATHPWTPYPNYPNDWWDISINEYPQLYDNPDQSTYSGIESYLLYKDANHQSIVDCFDGYYPGNVRPLYVIFTNIINNMRLNGNGGGKINLTQIERRMKWYIFDETYFPLDFDRLGRSIEFQQVNKNFAHALEAYSLIKDNFIGSWSSGIPVGITGSLGISFFDDTLEYCYDGIQNYYETGVDCGGSCPNACPAWQECTIFIDKQNAGDCLSGNYNVTSRQCNGNDGNKFDTLQEAGNVAVAGDVVCVRAGTYNETLRPVNSGTAGNLITFKAYPGDECKGTFAEPKLDDNPNPAYKCKVVLDGQNAPQEGISFSSGGKRKYIRVEGFEITGWPWGGVYFQSYYETGVEGIQIVNNYIHHNGDGIPARNALNSLIENNEIYANNFTAISLGGQDPYFTNGVTIRGNNIHYNGKDGVSASGTNIIIEFNKMYDQFHTDQHQDGIDADRVRNWVIRYNTISDFTQNIYLDSDDGGYHENVEIYGNVLYTDRYWTVVGGDAPGIFITPNTMGKDISIHSNTCGWLGMPCIRVYGNVTNLKIRNNLMVDSGINVELNDMSQVTSNYNLFYNTDALNKAKSDVSGEVRGGSTNSIFEQDPQLANYARHVSYDFHLKTTSPAVDRGADLATLFTLPSPFKDIDSTSRPQGNAFDIGAFEYNPGTTSCITQSALNIEIQKFYNSQIGIVEMSNKIMEYLGC